MKRVMRLFASSFCATAIAVPLCAAPAAAARTEIEIVPEPAQVTTCGQVVEGPAELANDLDCFNFFGGPAVTVLKGTLKLNGHTIFGNPLLDFTAGNEALESVIWCAATDIGANICKIVGPGRLMHGVQGIASDDGKLNVVRVTIENMRDTGVIVFQRFVFDGESFRRRRPSSARVKKSEIFENDFAGVLGRHVNMTRSKVRDNAFYGVQGTHIRIKKGRLTGNGTIGLESGVVGAAVLGRGRLNIDETRIDENVGHGIELEAGRSLASRNLAVSNSSVSGNGAAGIAFRGPVSVTNSNILGNGDEGILCERLVEMSNTDVSMNGDAGIRTTNGLAILGATVVDNCGDPNGDCTDLVSCIPPFVDDSECGTSSCDPAECDCGVTTTWGVCSLDP